MLAVRVRYPLMTSSTYYVVIKRETVGSGVPINCIMSKELQHIRASRMHHAEDRDTLRVRATYGVVNIHGEKKPDLQARNANFRNHASIILVFPSVSGFHKGRHRETHQPSTSYPTYV
jgi:hypothetical protein